MSEAVPLDVVMIHVDRALDGMSATLRDLGDDLVNAGTDLPGGNTAYQIVRHCCGVLEFWGGKVLADRPITRDRPAEFTSSGTVDEIVAIVAEQRAKFRADLQRFDGEADTPGEMNAWSMDPDESRTQAGVLMHVYEELAQHRGHLEITADIVRAR
ncbi:mycothiol transferase [Flexivirga sp. B27]